ncbi:MAG: ThuA domain-containing protein [Promicromonosporaceae bacterium]|nr:ThuA domain-containing protein [Promicromonosporaceae bacterium]
MTQRILILTGRGRHEDLWHDHAASSAHLAQILRHIDGVDIVIRSSFADSLADLAEYDLLVLNLSAPKPGYEAADLDPDADFAPLYEGLDGWARSGGRILAVHQATLAFPDEPRYPEILGGRWVPDVSGHPPIGDMALTTTGEHPIIAGLPEVIAFDERYNRLAVIDGLEVLGQVDDDEGRPHPALWVNQTHGGTTVYSALGHDDRSFASPTHRCLLRAAARWLLAQ